MTTVQEEYHATRKRVKPDAPTSENQKRGHVRKMLLSQIKPSPENDTLYRPIDPTDPEVRALAASIRQHGVKEPLVLTQDHFLLSGHRRYAASKLVGLSEVPCRFEPICHTDPEFMTLLREYNRQREKTDAERLRETIVDIDPEQALQNLRQYRIEAARVELHAIPLPERKPRSLITETKMPFLNAAIRVINGLRDFWPVSLRQIHYGLLNAPPLIHAKKPHSTYQNKRNCYQALSELLTKARLEGYIPFSIIHDETRPVTEWDTHDSTTPYLRRELRRFLNGFERDLLQTQPNHIEIVGEKNTLRGILAPVAVEYGIPFTIGRGYSSLPPRHDMAERFQRSGKEKLILLVLSDFDPDGETICQSFAQSMRDDFGIQAIHPVKVALTREIVSDLNLPPSGVKAKVGSSNYKKFVAKYGTDVYELEAVPPTELQRLLHEAVDSVLDIPAYNAQVDALKQDAASLDKMRRSVLAFLKEQGVEAEEVAA